MKRTFAVLGLVASGFRPFFLVFIVRAALLVLASPPAGGAGATPEERRP